MNKGRYWSVIGWDESLPENWIKRLKDTNLPIVISPHHDKDIEEETGELQKPHYHILLAWDGPTTFENVRTFAEENGLGSYVEKVRSVSNILDYMTHESYSSTGVKCKYDYNDIIWLNCRITDFVKIGYRDVILYIRDNQIRQFSKLVDKLIYDNKNDILDFVSTHTYYVNTYLCSLKTDIDKDIAEAYSMLKGYCAEVDRHGKFTIDREHYGKLMDLFEQLDIFSDDI